MAVHDVMYTFNPIHEYEFSWTIENFSLVPVVLRGPSFSPIPGLVRNFCFELRYKREYRLNESYRALEVFLIDLNGKDSSIIVSSYTTIRDTDDKIFTEATISYERFEGSIRLLAYCVPCSSLTSGIRGLSQIMKLLNDKLVVKGKLSLGGCDIVSSISSLVVEDESEACEELMNDLRTLYMSGSSSDVTIRVGKNSLHAHKNILVSRSPVFAKMFGSDMLENNSNEVVIKDADFYAFNLFLMFLYTGIVEDRKWNTVLSLYSLAHKYQVKSLRSICSGILGNSLTIESVCSVLVLSDLHGDKELKNVAKVFIRRHLQVVGTDEWVELATSKPQLVKEIVSFLGS